MAHRASKATAIRRRAILFRRKRTLDGAAAVRAGENHKQWWRKIEKRIEGTIVVHGSVFLEAIYRTFFFPYAKLGFPRSG